MNLKVTFIFAVAIFLSASAQQKKGNNIMEKIISKDGTAISYTKSGTGPPLLLVHGTTANHNRWNTVLPYFEKQFTVYAMDRRGRGGSSDSPDYNFLKEAEDIAAVVDSIGKPVFVLGHSFGSVCCLEAALLTKNIKRLILYEPPMPIGLPFYPEEAPGKMQKLIDEGKPEEALEFFFKKIVGMPDKEFEMYSKLPVYKERIKLAYTIPREMIIDKYYTFDAKRFSNVNVPTLMLLGGDSPPVFKKSTQAVNSALPDSRVIEMPGQQHIAMDTNTELFVNEVMKFLLE